MRLVNKVLRRLLREYRQLRYHGASVILLKPGAFGMFAVVNKTAYIASRVAADGKTLVVHWSKSPYRDPGHKGDPWEYYFEPVFPGADPRLAREHFREASFSKDDWIAPRLVKGVRDALDIPSDRARAAGFLDRFIRLNQATQDVVDAFAAENFRGPVIGLHIRGPGRVHGGAGELRAMADPDNPVPYALYFDAVDAALLTLPKAHIFACSDSQVVIDRIKKQYGNRVITYPSSRSDFGEMHDNHPNNQGEVYSPYKLGLDIVAEAHLLARCVHFVHGNSNVANYVLCRAPDMPSQYVYAHLVDQLTKKLALRK